ncbi:hypothetical protein [Mesorhizobium kowhaii]|uniref:hypothetical protein n=1 Tax=Mesorhizobium kowhaii TaxID=1300272 RepID=UPI0011B40A11|nr:hypothetical protein [Mesorhizobium kowhaii]
MMPDLSCRHPRVSGKALSMGTKRKRSDSLGLTEPFHRNFLEYSNLRGFFTPKKRFCKNHLPLSQMPSLLSQMPSGQMPIADGRQQKSGRDRSRPD